MNKVPLVSSGENKEEVYVNFSEALFWRACLRLFLCRVRPSFRSHQPKASIPEFIPNIAYKKNAGPHNLLNIYRPRRGKMSKSRPVIFLIHGGYWSMDLVWSRIQ